MWNLDPSNLIWTMPAQEDRSSLRPAPRGGSIAWRRMGRAVGRRWPVLGVALVLGFLGLAFYYPLAVVLRDGVSEGGRLTFGPLRAVLAESHVTTKSDVLRDPEARLSAPRGPKARQNGHFRDHPERLLQRGWTRARSARSTRPGGEGTPGPVTGTDSGLRGSRATRSSRLPTCVRARRGGSRGWTGGSASRRST